MALYRIDTNHFAVVNTDDDCYTKPEKPRNEWLPLADCMGHLRDGYTSLRVRALTALEAAGIDIDKGRNAMLEFAKAGCHPDDLTILAGLPWQYHMSLGSFVYQVSTFPLDRAK